MKETEIEETKLRKIREEVVAKRTNVYIDRIPAYVLILVMV